ncbi:hypothetical protein ACSBR1_033915 [Camellia fascicularis]
MSRLNDYGEEEDIWNGEGKMVVIANACKVPTTFVSELTESEDPDECVKHSDEDQELEQLISGEICLRKCFAETHTSDMERRIVLSGSFNPLHEGHLKLLEVATSRSSLSLSQQQQQQHQRGLVQVILLLLAQALTISLSLSHYPHRLSVAGTASTSSPVLPPASMYSFPLLSSGLLDCLLLCSPHWFN